MFTLVKNQKLDSSAGYLPSVLSKITSIPAGFVGICSAEHFLLGLQNKGNVLCGGVCVSVHTPTPQPHCHLLLTFSYQNLFFLFKIIFFSYTNFIKKSNESPNPVFLRYRDTDKNIFNFLWGICISSGQSHCKDDDDIVELIISLSSIYKASPNSVYLME